MSDRERKNRKRAKRLAVKAHHERQRQERAAVRRPTAGLTPEEYRTAVAVGAGQTCLFCHRPTGGRGHRVFTIGDAWAPLPRKQGHPYEAALCADCQLLPQVEKDQRLSALVRDTWLGVNLPPAVRRRVANGLLARSAS
jgi:hypothetical protein